MEMVLQLRNKVLDITDNELHLPNQVRAFLRFHVYFTIRRILFETGGSQASVPLPGDPVFSQKENKYSVSVYNSICSEFGINPNSDFRFDKFIYGPVH